jgi:gamma-glutamylcyclotransferase (GGCT)/AIG2-like uncharacterized protein YtfP
MPLYFSYGANMDLETMRQHCPRARVLGRATLMRHRWFIMESGYASVKRDAHSAVHGLLYDLPFADIPALDRYEDVGRGLYQKITQPVVRDGAAPMRALLYVGTSTKDGTSAPAYLETILAAARAHNFPAQYIAHVASFGAVGETGGAPIARRAIKLKGI